MPLAPPVSLFETIVCSQEKARSLIGNTINQVSEYLLSSIDNNKYHFKDVLHQTDRAEFIKAMETEIDVHQRRNHWELLKCSDVSKGMKPIMSIWAFKRKKLTDGTLLKYKARSCAYGGQQQWRVNYWEAHTPVANWASVRLLLALSHMHGLESRSIDFYWHSRMRYLK